MTFIVRAANRCVADLLERLLDRIAPIPTIPAIDDEDGDYLLGEYPPLDPLRPSGRSTPRAPAPPPD